jgi:hypothetical protein
LFVFFSITALYILKFAMKTPCSALPLLAAGLVLATTTLRAGPADEISAPPPPVETPSMPISQEFFVNSSVTGNTEMKQGNAKLGGVSDINTHVNYVASPQLNDDVLFRVGFDWERNSFGLFNSAPLPNTLESAYLVLGTDLVVSNKIILRIEAHPGIYSDFVSITGRDFDMPLQFGGTYLVSKDLQLIFGIQVDLKSSIPIIGLPGIRWQFADNWVLSAIPPKPQLQYLVNNSLTLYTGAEILGGTYQLNQNFGNSHGHGIGTTNSQLNNNIVDFAEVRVGGGLTWKFIPTMSLDVSAGYIPYRSFNMHSAQIGFHQDRTTFKSDFSGGAPYGEIGIKGSF